MDDFTKGKKEVATTIGETIGRELAMLEDENIRYLARVIRSDLHQEDSPDTTVSNAFYACFEERYINLIDEDE